LHCLIYFKADARFRGARQSGRSAAKLAALKAEPRKNRTIRRPFTSPEDLARQVTADVHNWLFRTYLPDVLNLATVSGDEAHVRRTAAGVPDTTAFREGLEVHGFQPGEDAVGSLLATGHRKFLDVFSPGSPACRSTMRAGSRMFWSSTSVRR
jgi:hypothetical protein